MSEQPQPLDLDLVEGIGSEAGPVEAPQVVKKIQANAGLRVRSHLKGGIGAQPIRVCIKINSEVPDAIGGEMQQFAE